MNVNERINKIENSLGIGKQATTPWWRKSVAVVPIVVAIVSAINPIGIAISGYYSNQQAENRRILDQQNSIRQNYLDRIFKGQLNIRQEQQIFRLLSKLGADPTFQQWAKREMEVRNREIDLNSTIIKDASRKIDSLIKENVRRNDVQIELERNRSKLRDASSKLGDPLPWAGIKEYRHSYPLIISQNSQKVQFVLNLVAGNGKPYPVGSSIFHCINWKDIQKIRTSDEYGRLTLPAGTYIAVVEGANLFENQKVFTYESGNVLYVNFTLSEKSQ